MGYSRALQIVRDQGDETEPAKKTEKNRHRDKRRTKRVLKVKCKDKF